MKKFFTILIASVLSTVLFAATQGKLALLDETAISTTQKLQKAINAFGTSKSFKAPQKQLQTTTHEAKLIASPTAKKAPAEVITLTGEGFLVGPEYEAETGEWYVACEAQGYTFRLCWYSTADNFTGTFNIDDIDLEDSWGWFQSDDLFYEIFYSDVTMTVSEKTKGNLKQIVIDATILDNQDRTYQLHTVHNTFTPKSTVEHTISNGQLNFGFGQYTLKGNNDNLDMEIVVNSEVVDGVFTNTDLDLNQTNITYLGQTQQLLQTNLSVMPATFENGTLGYNVDFAFYNQDTILHEVSMPTPLPDALDTIEIQCNNLELDETLKDFGFIMITGANDDYDIVAMYQASYIEPGTYQNVAVTICDKITWQPVESITATMTLTRETDTWHVHIETYAMDYNWYSIDMRYIVPEPTRTVKISFESSAMASFRPDQFNMIQLLHENTNTDYDASLTIYGIGLNENFSRNNVVMDYSGIYNKSAGRSVQFADVSGKLSQRGDTTLINASVIGWDAVQYDLELWYIVPTPTQTIEIEMPVKFTNALDYGYYTLSAYTPDSAWFVHLTPGTDEVAGTFVNDGMFGKFGEGQYDFLCGDTYVYSSADMRPYTVEKGTLEVQLATDGTITAEAYLICSNAIAYHIKMITEYNEYLDFDEPYTEIYRTYTTEDNVTIDDQTALNDFIYLSLTAADGSDMAAFFFYVEESDEETIVPVGTYPIDYSEDYGTVQANPGVQGNGVYPSFYAEMMEDGSLVTPLWLLIDGTVEVSQNKDGYIYLVAEAYNSYGVPVHIEFDGTPRGTGVEHITSTTETTKKVLKDGQILIIRNGKTYNIVGQLAQ